MNNEALAMVLRKLLTIVGTVLTARGFLPQGTIDTDLIEGLVGLAMLGISTYWSNRNRKKLEDVPGPAGK